MSAANTFGEFFKLTTFGESHGRAIGGVIDGMPAGFQIDFNHVQKAMKHRRPGQELTSKRIEPDEIIWLSGLKENITTGTPIAFIIENKGHVSQDYSHLQQVFRPGHAQYTYLQKYGDVIVSGGGRSSGRETAVRVAAGAIAEQALNQMGIQVSSHLQQCGPIKCPESYKNHFHSEMDLLCPDRDTHQAYKEYLNKLSEQGDSCGGIVSFCITNPPQGLGDPMYEKLEAILAKAMMSIPATKGFEIGLGYGAVAMNGSTHNDEMNKDTIFKTNRSGGILGGISNGQNIYGTVAFKPTSSIQHKQNTLQFDFKETQLQLNTKRHDPCIALRGTYVVKAMCCLVMIDRLLANQTSKWNTILSSKASKTPD